MIKVLIGDALEQLRTLGDESVHCVVTSPPYWGLRDYSRCGCATKSDLHQLPPEGGYETGFRSERYVCADAQGGKATKLEPRPECSICHGTGLIDGVKEHQLGLEKTPEEHITKMTEIFREVKRILRSDGTLWLNMGDCYNGTGAVSGEKQFAGMQGGNVGSRGMMAKNIKDGLKPKDLVGMPWRLAFTLQADGWYLRSDIIWAKPNPMPESVTDRPTKSHEYIFLLTKNARYFYDQDAVREKQQPNTEKWKERYTLDLKKGVDSSRNDLESLSYFSNPAGRNSRTVWEMPTQPYAEAHFATFPEELPRRCIKAGTSEKGCCSKCGSPWERIVESKTNKNSWGPARKTSYCAGNLCGRAGDVTTKTLGWQPTCSCNAEVVPCVVLDPFAGSGTTGLVARSLGRKSILIELNPQYGELIRKRSMSDVPDICEAFS